MDVRTTGADECEINGLTTDSRKVQEGMCYIAIPGTKLDGNGFVANAIEAGAKAVVSERECPAELKGTGVTWIQVGDAREAAGLMASAWNGFPSRDMKVVGVTGTNGKTTTAFIIHSIFKKVWQRAGLIGTIICDNGKDVVESSLTTPAPVDLQDMLGNMADNGCRGVAMEVSSQAMDQKRVAGTEFDVCIFSNLTQDHLDYHHDMERYFLAKAALFEQMANQSKYKKKKVALINADDAYGKRLIDMFASRLTVKTYGFSVGCDFRLLAHNISARGCEYELSYNDKSYLVRVPLIGRFNILNSAAAIAGAVCAGVPVRDAVSSMSECPQVPGRMELAGNRCGIQVFVDYAHTPDALENVCKTLKEICPKRLITVFGCGGDRDSAKRPLMGAAAAKFSDICIVTSDNPRSEVPASIIEQILSGMPAGVESIIDRTEAIMTAVMNGRKGDIVLIAGKGHEDYQEIAGERISFSDGRVARRALMMKEEELNEKFNQ